MPKLGMEPIRRAALVKATIAEIGVQGSLDVTVSQIAKRAGMSAALAHHYFGGKEDIFLAAMRHTLSLYGAEVRGALLMAKGPRQRIEAIILAGFGTANFRREIVAAWLNFYVLAQTSPKAKRPRPLCLPRQSFGGHAIKNCDQVLRTGRLNRSCVDLGL